MIHPRVQLVTAEVVATMHGISCEAVYHRVDTAEGWMWVWNVGAGSERSLRFWSREQNGDTSKLTLDAVIAQIVPRRKLSGGIQKWEVAELLRVSRRQLLDLDLRFIPRAGGMWIATGELENFFRRRWLFAATKRS